MDFNKMSDEELQKIVASRPKENAAPDFDKMSDEELMKIVASRPAPEESLGRRMTRSAINAVLPAAGAIGGGLLAAPETAGVGAIPAAALGYAAGKQGARVLNHYLLGDEPGATGLPGVAKQTAGDVANGVMYEMGGQALRAAGSGARALAEDLATAPFGKAGIEEAGGLARALNLIGRGGKYVNDKLDDLVSPMVARTGNDAADKVLANVAKRAGYFTPFGKINAAADVAQAAPYITQKLAGPTASAMNAVAPAGQYATPALQALFAAKEAQSGGPLERRMTKLSQK